MPKKVLVAPLDWGLGHATRCIPVIQELIKQGHEVLIAADDNVEHLLKEEFPELKFIYFRGYHVSYSSRLPAWFKILIQLPKILIRIIAEHRQLKKIIREHKIDVVISDNRFGLWNQNIKSIYITHQLMIKCPNEFKLFEPLLYRLHQIIINRYDLCWIPDFEGENNLTGDLSHKYTKPTNAKFIGSLSRLKYVDSVATMKYDLCFIISGPEPARSEFQKIVFEKLKSYSGKVVVILGNPKSSNHYSENNIEVFPYLNANQLKDIIAKSKLIVCRSGYSSIMDLVALKKDALLVATPGQTEQEYLAEYLDEKKIFKRILQSEMNIEMLNRDKNFSVNNFKVYLPDLLQEEINKINSYE
jgi:uncharacterized protein (TIGR00661 family)